MEKTKKFTSTDRNFARSAKVEFDNVSWWNKAKAAVFTGVGGAIGLTIMAPVSLGKATVNITKENPFTSVKDSLSAGWYGG